MLRSERVRCATDELCPETVPSTVPHRTARIYAARRRVAARLAAVPAARRAGARARRLGGAGGPQAGGGGDGRGGRDAADAWSASVSVSVAYGARARPRRHRCANGGGGGGPAHVARPPPRLCLHLHVLSPLLTTRSERRAAAVAAAAVQCVQPPDGHQQSARALPAAFGQLHTRRLGLFECAAHCSTQFDSIQMHCTRLTLTALCRGTTVHSVQVHVLL